MQSRIVKSPADIRLFLNLPDKINAGDPNWIRPLDPDIERVFDPKKNKYFENGDCVRWILLDDKGECIGRVAAFFNERTAKKNDFPVGGMGFFDCINDQSAANKLFDLCKEWLQAKGMEAMDGPINFGDRDNWWGCLKEGFLPPVYGMPYNPPYYIQLFENYGFKTYFEQFILHRNIMEPAQEKFIEKYEQLMKDPGYHFEHVQKNNLNKYAIDMKEIYNAAWVKHDGHKEMTDEQAISAMSRLKQILVPELVWFGYYNKKPISFFIMIPDLNPIIKNFHGKFGLIHKLRTWFALKFGGGRKIYGVAFGVIPEHQGKGVEGGIVVSASHVLHPLNKYDHMEMIWIGDFNPKMLHVAEAVGGKKIKTYITFRKLFDPNREFVRAPMI